jgi:hypothetical protein
MVGRMNPSIWKGGELGKEESIPGSGNYAWFLQVFLQPETDFPTGAGWPGTDVMISKIFSPKKLAFLIQNKAKLFKNLIIALAFEKNANFFAENCWKSQKIVIITSTPDE